MFWQAVFRNYAPLVNSFAVCWPFFFFGIAGGIPMALVSSTSSAALATSGVDKSLIGFFSLVTLPYSLRFLFSILVDFIDLKPLASFFGVCTRSILLVVSNLLMLGPILLFCFSDFGSHKVFLFFVSMLLIATFASLSDIAVDGIRIKNVKNELSGFAVSAAVLGYRIGLLLGGGGALLISHYLPFSSSLNWKVVYFTLYCVVLFSAIVPVLLSKFTNLSYSNNYVDYFDSSKIEDNDKKENNLSFSFISFKKFLSSFFEKNDSIIVIFFAFLYKAGDSLSGAMLTVFLLDLGFTLGEVGYVVKFVGFFTITLGSFFGSIFIKKFGIISSLVFFGFFSMISNIASIVQYFVGPKIAMLYFMISIENIFHGASMIAFLSFLTASCKSRPYEITRYSFLVTASSIARMLIPILGGFIAKYYGWVCYFSVAILIAIPGLLLLLPIKNKFVDAHGGV